MITHQGTITKVMPGQVVVSIAPDQDECSGCGIAMLCSKGETVTVDCGDADQSMIGRRVVIGASVGVQRRGTLLFFAVPLALLVVVLVVALILGESQQMAAVLSIVSVAVWYAILYLLKVRMRSHAQFSVVRFES